VSQDDLAGAARVVLIGVALVATFIFFFVYPSHDPKPNHLPVGAVGPPEQLAGAIAALERDGELDVRRFDREAAARSAILERDVYGALILRRKPKLLVATAASFQVESILEGVAQGALGGRQPVIRSCVRSTPRTRGG
jgi:hypothetical protein